MTDRDVKHCGKLTQHDDHDWDGVGQSTVVLSDPENWQFGDFKTIGPHYWCKGTIVVEGGHW